jgi:ABC-type multidrug transport system fused ATPase/permease subunit
LSATEGERIWCASQRHVGADVTGVNRSCDMHAVWAANTRERPDSQCGHEGATHTRHLHITRCAGAPRRVRCFEARAAFRRRDVAFISKQSSFWRSARGPQNLGTHIFDCYLGFYWTLPSVDPSVAATQMPLRNARFVHPTRGTLRESPRGSSHHPPFSHARGMAGEDVNIKVHRAVPFDGSPAEDTRLSFAWEGLHYEVTTKQGERKTLLEGITGVANASEMFYVMGPSGAGKSTFLAGAYTRSLHSLT